MTQVTKSQIQKAKQMDLLTYLQLYEPNNLKRKGHDYTTKEHDSMSISENGLWRWCSRDIGGKTALKYLIDVKGMQFVDAVLTLCNEPVQVLEPPLPTSIKKKKPFALPDPYHNNNRVISYLQCRGISDNIITYCINHNLIYESKDYRNAVFVGYDENNIARYGALRGTWDKAKIPFKGEIESSMKEYCFSIKVDSNKLIVTESAIDALSVASIRGDIDCNYLSIGGAYAPKKDNSTARLPVALTNFLDNSPHIEEIVLCLDNDTTGLGASKHIGRKLAYMGYKVVSRPPQKEKDYNDVVTKKRSSSNYER